METILTPTANIPLLLFHRSQHDRQEKPGVYITASRVRQFESQYRPFATSQDEAAHTVQGAKVKVPYHGPYTRAPNYTNRAWVHARRLNTEPHNTATDISITRIRFRARHTIHWCTSPHLPPPATLAVLLGVVATLSGRSARKVD